MKEVAEVGLENGEGGRDLGGGRGGIGEGGRDEGGGRGKGGGGRGDGGCGDRRWMM